MYAVDGDGTLNLGVCDADGKNISRLTNFKNGEQVYTPVWSKDGKKIAFGYSIGHNQSVALIDSNGNNFVVLTHSGDCRNPFFLSDSTLAYSWDRGGIFNIYTLNLRTLIEKQTTNVLGGAFLPAGNGKGDLAYVTYTSSGYKIALLPCDSTAVPQALISDKDSLQAAFHTQNLYSGRIETQAGEQALPASISAAGDENQSPAQAKPYHTKFTSISLIPLLRIDTYNKNSSGLDVVKPGAVHIFRRRSR